MTVKILLGQTLQFHANPFGTAPQSAAQHIARGAVVIAAGRIVAIGPATDMRAAYPDAEETDCGDALLLPGFVDCHAHYPQTGIIASWGKRLIDWLNSYTFPEEMRFSDPAYASTIAESYLDFSLRHGITSLSAYCTIHPQSVEALMQAARNRGMRITAGKVMMDRDTAPEGLRDVAQQSYEDTLALIAKWHGVDRLSYAITPRFAPTSTEAQLEAAGTAWAEHPDCAMQTHLSEQMEEIAWVKSLYPDDADYLGIYERFGLTGPGAIMGHAIHLEARERAAILADGTGIAHCPTSNQFIGSGLCDVMGLARDGVPIGLATDVGGGSSFSMLRTMAAAYDISQLRGEPLHPAQLLWLATIGSATVLRQPGVGRLEPGAEADIIALNLRSTPIIAQRADRADTIWEAVFPTIMMGDDRAIARVWVGGAPVVLPELL